MGLSSFVKNGQNLPLRSGSAQINPGDLLEIGGPGNEAWPVATADYAQSPAASTLRIQTPLVAAALAGKTRQQAETDNQGNIVALGTNASGNLVAYRSPPLGTTVTSAVLDGTATSVYTPRLVPLLNASTAWAQSTGYAAGQRVSNGFGYFLCAAAGTSASTGTGPTPVALTDGTATWIFLGTAPPKNGTFAAVYARASGALYFVVFDAQLDIIAGPTSIATEYNSSSVVYHDACALAAGGFAVAYQSSAGTAIELQTFSNAGAAVLAATSVQTTSASQAALKLGQLPNGNLVVAMRTAGTPAGTSFVVVSSTTGANVVANVSVDGTAVFGLLELNLVAGCFAIAEANGTNLVCSVYSSAGALQGSQYSVADTRNSTSLAQLAIDNDGTQFWLGYIGSAANGVNVVQLPLSGSGQRALTGLGSASITGTFALAIRVISGLLVAFAADSSTGGQYWLSVGLPDASLGIAAPYLRTAATAFGAAAGTTGSNWPRVLSGGDFTAVFVYDQQSTAGTFFGIQKVEYSAIIGVSQTVVTAGNPGTAVTTNSGPGSYPANPILGTNGTPFNHTSSTPAGGEGIVYSGGVALTQAPAVSVSTSISTQSSTVLPGQTTMPGNGAWKSSIILFDTLPGTRNFTVPENVHSIRAFVVGPGGGASSGGAPGGGYSEIVLSVTPGEVFAYTVGTPGVMGSSATAGTTTSFGGVLSATGGGTSSSSVGSGSGGTINTSGGPGGANGGGGASGHRYGNGQLGLVGGGGWGQAGNAINGGNGGVDGFGLGLIPGLGGIGEPTATMAQAASGGYGAGGGGAPFGASGGNGGIGGGGGNAGSGSVPAGHGGIGGGAGASSTPSVLSGAGCVGIEVLG